MIQTQAGSLRVPASVQGGGSFVAFIKDGSKTYHANNLSELKKQCRMLKKINISLRI